MVTNLPEQAKAKWAEVVASKNPVTKLRLLKEFYSSFPKHKGTERLEKSIKRQIKSLELQVQKASSKRRGSSRLEWVVKKQELPQLVIVGTLHMATSFFNILTKSNVKNHEPLIKPFLGVFEGARVQFQLILVPFDRNLGEGKLDRFMNLVRNADGILVVLGKEPLSYVKDLINWFESHNIDIFSNYTKVEIKETPSGGIRIAGSSDLCNEKEIVDFLSEYKIKNAIVKITRDSTLDDVESALFGRMVKNTIFVTLFKEQGEQLKTLVPNLIILDSNMNIEIFVLHILKRLNMIRIYTKIIGGEIANKPLMMKEGARAIDVAREIHKDLSRFFRYARLWRKDALDGIKIGQSFQLEDEDIIEIHSS